MLESFSVHVDCAYPIVQALFTGTGFFLFLSSAHLHWHGSGFVMFVWVVSRVGWVRWEAREIDRPRPESVNSGNPTLRHREGTKHNQWW